MGALFAHQWGYQTPYDIGQSVDALVDEPGDAVELAGVDDLIEDVSEEGYSELTPVEASAYALELAWR